MNTLSEHDIRLTLKAIEEHNGNQTKAAEALGVARSTLQARLRQYRDVATGGLSQPDTSSGPIPGTSILYRGTEEGDPILTWVKTPAVQLRRSPEDTARIIRDTLAEVRPLPILPVRREDVHRKDLATVYPIADLHLGMYSWAPETGNDFDLVHAEEILLTTMETLVSRAPPSDTALILNLGDFFHSDSNENRTRRSGAALDVDTRYAKVLSTGVKLMVDVILLALQKHKSVYWRGLPGNHDPYAALALTIALGQRFNGDRDRVYIDPSPSPFFFWQFGDNLIGATHGDMAKPEDMPGIMAAKAPDAWGATEFRYIYTGHLHTRKKRLVNEGQGAQVEVFETLAPRDAWGNSMGFVAGRSMSAITLHNREGEHVRHTVNIGGQR